MERPLEDRFIDHLGLIDVDYVELWVGNALQATHYYQTVFGFQLAGYRGLETGTRDRHAYLLTQGNIRLVISAPLHGDSPIAEFVKTHGDGVRDMATLKPVFRLRTRVVRVERLEAGDKAGFYGTFEPDRPTWVGLLPVGRTDGYPSAANGTCEVLINGRLYPVVGGVNSAHAIIDVGEAQTVAPGDVATLIGPDHPAIHPHEVARRTGTGFLAMIQGMNPRLPRIVV